jgi:uncharacterized protein YraI
MKKIIILLVLMMVAVGVDAQKSYPARCRVTTNLNVRISPSKNASKIGLYRNGEIITVEYVTGSSNDPWGAVTYGARRGYVSMRYVNYVYRVTQTSNTPSKQIGTSKKSKSGIAGFFAGVWKVIKWILWAVAFILILALWEYIIELAIYAGLFAGGGALLFAIFGGSGSTGAIVGLVVAAVMGVGWLLNRMDISVSDIEVGGLFRIIFIGAYYLFSFPVYFLNRLEHFLVSPWRYFFKKNWPSDSTKPTWRVVTEVVTVVMYIVTTPLRLANAIIYNIFIHCVTGIYDLLLEVLAPSDYKEGGEGVWTWIYMLPWRFLKYAVWHVALLLIESVIWTVVDIFIPARTFYHGTNLNAGKAITSDPHRNRYMQNTSGWSSGTFLASSNNDCSWAGKGVYFAIQRRLALAYSGDNRSGYGGDAVMIACRVSMGRVISYSLMPDYVYRQAGGGGKHGEINKFADAHGYKMGEWYNYAGVWEYCLFDWQNRYNHPWRIRPIYMLNLRTGRAQHVTGGMQHWLFDKDVMEDLGII